MAVLCPPSASVLSLGFPQSLSLARGLAHSVCGHGTLVAGSTGKWGMGLGSSLKCRGRNGPLSKLQDACYALWPAKESPGEQTEQSQSSSYGRGPAQELLPPWNPISNTSRRCWGRMASEDKDPHGSATWGPVRGPSDPTIPKAHGLCSPS